MKHEYTDGELAELKKIYDESGKAGLSRDEMRAMRKAGLVAQTNQNTVKEPDTMTATTTPVQEQKPTTPENPRAIISNALTGIFDAISALQRTAFQANDKVVYGFATKMLNGELMDLKANYSKDVAK